MHRHDRPQPLLNDRGPRTATARPHTGSNPPAVLLILGSTAGQVLVDSPIPVLVVHRAFAGAVRRVLFAADGDSHRTFIHHP